MTLKHLRGKLSAGLLKIVPLSLILIISTTLGISISHILGTSNLEVLWQIERVPSLADDHTLALICYS